VGGIPQKGGSQVDFMGIAVTVWDVESGEDITEQMVAQIQEQQQALEEQEGQN
jgi:hypothetical protein